MTAPAWFGSASHRRSGGSVCGATDLVLRWPRPSILFTPPAPPHDGNRPQRGQTEQVGGRSIAKIHQGGIGILKKPVDDSPQNPANPCGSKAEAPPGCFQNPRVVPFSPCVGSFSPRVCFCVFASFLPSSSSFSLEKERELKRGRHSIPVFFECQFFKQTTNFQKFPVSGDAVNRPVEFFGKPWDSFAYKSMSYLTFPWFFSLPREKTACPSGSGGVTIGLTLTDFVLKAGAVEHNSPVSSKIGLIGCGSPKARGAEPHPARFAAFSVLSTSFGGSNGRAQVLPVTLRVPRSSTPVRAAARCGSWSAVVHMARLEINMNSISPCPVNPGETPFTVFSPERLELLHDVRIDADRVNAALASVMELLQGCNPGYTLSASNLESLLEPVWAGLDTLCGDLRTVDKPNLFN